MNNLLLQRVKTMFKTARANKVTISKDGKSWTFPSMEATARYFGIISSFNSNQIMKMIENREKYICGFYVTYDN